MNHGERSHHQADPNPFTDLFLTLRDPDGYPPFWRVTVDRPPVEQPRCEAFYFAWGPQRRANVGELK